MATKIKNIFDITPWDSVLFSSWLAAQGIDRKGQSLYVQSGWLERIAQGVYKKAGSHPTLYGAVASYNNQLGKSCHVGASSALDLRGYSHFVSMGKPSAYLFTDKESRLPGWFGSVEWDMSVRYFTTSIFGGNLGLEVYDYNGVQLLISSPERAFMECLHLSPEQFTLLDSYYVMEMMTTLRPALVQQLLEKCTSIKVKRLFLYMAEKAGHSWFRAIDLSNVNLGKGIRNISATGRFDKRYQIIIPAELADYE
ncbi:MAG: type IV toxin-antitoxin system AbiEi family antitoxin [Bacteroidales bacterium]|nr:type IV toxin-antitoxin system AbiEi family antitoxin [Bacteroidales bacterium]